MGTRPDLPDPAVYRGREETRSSAEDLLQLFEDLRVEPDRFLEADDEVVAVSATAPWADCRSSSRFGVICTTSNGSGDLHSILSGLGEGPRSRPGFEE